MAACPTASRLITRLLPCLVLAAGTVLAQAPLSLAEAGARKPGDFSPVHLGREIVVRGTAPLAAIPILDYAHVAIQDSSGYGFVLEAPLAQFAGVAPGDELEARGVVAARGGLPVLHPSELRVVSRGGRIEPQRLLPEDLNGIRYLGVLVLTQGTLQAVGENAGGHYLLVGPKSRPLKVFLPHLSRRGGTGLLDFKTGDTVQVRGISSQYCVFPPFNDYFQVLIPDGESVTLLERPIPVRPEMLVAALVALWVALVVWWTRERRMATQRRQMQRFFRLGEEILAVRSPEETAHKLEAVLPAVLPGQESRLYAYERERRALQRLGAGPHPAGSPFSVDKPEGLLQTGAAIAFKNRTLLTVPDTTRSPFFQPGERGLPQSVVFVPLFAQSETLGILEIDYARRVRRFRPDQLALAQHLANQVGMAWRLLEQQSMRDRLFRSEKLAAAGQLASGIAKELKSPLDTLAALALEAGSATPNAGLERQLRAISDEARRASEIVSRVVALTRPDSSEAKPVDLMELLRGLVDFREAEWKARGLSVENLLPPGPLPVIGSRGQLEQVFLNLLVHVEQTLAGEAGKQLRLNASVLAHRVVVSISHTCALETAQGRDPFSPEAGDGSGGLDVCIGIVQSHGGDIRFVAGTGGSCCFEVDLPLAEAAPVSDAATSETAAPSLTILLVEPSAAARQELMLLLGERKHRVIPAPGGEAAAGMIERLHFDYLFCSVRLPGMNWVELYEKTRGRNTHFVLLTEGYDDGLSRAFPHGDGSILTRPVRQADLDRVLALATQP